MYVLKNLPKLQARPVKLQERVFEKLFNEAELAKLTPDDMRTYEEGLKIYRDNKNAMDYAIKNAREETLRDTAKKLKELGVDPLLIIQATGLTREQIEKL